MTDGADTPPRRPPVAATDTLLAHGQQRVGTGRHAVIVFVNAKRKGVLYLRWREGGQLAYLSLGITLPPAPDATVKAKSRREAMERARARAADAALAAASTKALERAGGGATAAPDPAPTAAEAHAALRQATQRALTIEGARAILTEPGAGRFAAGTPYHKDVLAALDRAVAVWGGDTCWSAIRRADYTRFWRAEFARIRAAETRPDGHGGERPRFDGYAGTRSLVVRLLRVVDALRDGEAIEEDWAEPPRKWLDKLTTDFAELHGGGETPAVHRPRFTLGQMRALHAAAPAVDPRVALAMAIGAELRPIQVLRLRRSHVVITAPEGDAGAHEFGLAAVRGRGKKGGVVVELTREQRAAVDAAFDRAAGYLRACEAAYQAAQAAPGAAPTAGDYPLFPGGRLSTQRRERPRTPIPALFPAEAAGGPAMHYETLRNLFTDVMARAEIPRRERLGWYGMRRGTVDAADTLNVSTGALQQLGGWTSADTPLLIYKDRESVADRRAARDARAAIRGEASAADVPQPPRVADRNGGEGKRRQDVDTAAPPRAPSEDSTPKPVNHNDL